MAERGFKRGQVGSLEKHTNKQSIKFNFNMLNHTNFEIKADLVMQLCMHTNRLMKS